MTDPRPGEPPRRSPVVRLLYVGLGLWFVGLGFLGAILPGLPATPFFLLAAFFFARSSTRLYRWLLRSPVAGPLIRDWQRPGGGVRWQVKAVTLVLLPVVIGSSIYLAGLSGWRMLGLIALGLIGAIVVLLLPLAKPLPLTPADPGEPQRQQAQQPAQAEQPKRLQEQYHLHPPTIGQPPGSEMPQGMGDRQHGQP